MSKPTLDSFGNMVEGTFTTRTVRGTIQPVTGEEAIAYQEGGRNTGIVTSASELQPLKALEARLNTL